METQDKSGTPNLVELLGGYGVASESNLASALDAIADFKDAVSLIQAAVGEIDTKKEEAKQEIQDLFGALGLGVGGEEGEGGFNLMALLLGGDQEGLASKGGLGVLAGLLGVLNGEGEGENPLEGVFASTYEKYLNGNGEDVAGLIPTYQQLLIEAGGAVMFTATLKPALGTAPSWALMS